MRAKPAQVPAGSFKLKFAWPKELRARVLSTRRVEKNSSPPIGAELTWMFLARAADSGWSVDLESVNVQRVSGGLEEEVFDSALVFQQVLPSLRLNANGEFAGLVSPERSRQQLLSSTLRALPGHADKAKAEKLFTALLDDQPFALSAQNNWTSLVSSLIGKEFRGNEKYVSVAEVPVPLLGTPLSFDNVIRVSGPMPCFTGDDRTRCIWIEVTSRPQAKALATALSRAGARMPLTMPEIKAIDSNYTTEIVTEVDRLVPHWFHLRQAHDVTFVHEGGQLQLHQVQDRSDAFHYATVP